MSTVYIYIGTQKTGTTALQTFLHGNEEELNKQGYCYPSFQLGIESLYMYRNGQFLIYQLRPKEKRTERGEQVRDMAYAQLRDYIEKYPNIILSDEMIWHQSRYDEHFWSDLLERFQALGCDVKVIVYLRRQDLTVQSLWNQGIKMFFKNKMTLRTYVEDKHYRVYRFDYYENLKHIEKYVGKENIIVRPYERGRFEGEQHTLFSDFFKSVGLVLTDGFNQENVRKNYGLEGNFVEIKRWINSMPCYSEMRDFMGRPVLNASTHYSLLGENEKANMFTYEEQKAFLAQFEESNRKVAQEYLGRKDEPLFYDDVKEVPVWTLREDRMSRDIVAIMAEALGMQQKQIDDLRNELREVKEKVERERNILPLRAYRKVRGVLKH